MLLQEIKRMFQKDAEKIPEYNLLTPTELGNGYCDAEESGDESMRSAYWSALMVRYWYKIPRWQQTSLSLNLPAEEFVDWLTQCLSGAFYYRSWRFEYEAVVKNGKFISWKLDKEGKRIPNKHYWKTDPNAVDRTINFFCSAQRGRVYQYVNKDKRKSSGQTLSIESMVDDNGRQIDSIGHTAPLEVDGAHELVGIFLRNDKPLEALVVDGVAYQDSFKTKKETIRRIETNSQGQPTNKRYTSNSEVFDIRRLVKHLSSINTDFIRNYFCSTYLLSNEEGEKILSKLSNMSNPKWYKCIQKTIMEIKENKKLLSCLLDID